MSKGPNLCEKEIKAYTSYGLSSLTINVNNLRPWKIPLVGDQLASKQNVCL